MSSNQTPSNDHDAILVDATDKVIGYKNRHQLEAGDIIRIAALWIEDTHGNVLLAQRSLQKRSDPGVWGPAAAGTLEPDETYEINIIKEAAEEIGLHLTTYQLEHISKEMYIRPTDNIGRISMWYRVVLNDTALEQFTLYRPEVEQLAWRNKAELYAEVAAHPERFVPSAPIIWNKLFPLA